MSGLPSINSYRVWCYDTGVSHGGWDTDTDAAGQAQTLADNFPGKTFVVFAAIAMYNTSEQLIKTNNNAVVDAPNATVTSAETPITMAVPVPTPPTPSQPST